MGDGLVVRVHDEDVSRGECPRYSDRSSLAGNGDLRSGCASPEDVVEFRIRIGTSGLSYFFPEICSPSFVEPRLVVYRMKERFHRRKGDYPLNEGEIVMFPVELDGGYRGPNPASFSSDEYVEISFGFGEIFLDFIDLRIEVVCGVRCDIHFELYLPSSVILREKTTSVIPRKVKGR